MRVKMFSAAAIVLLAAGAAITWLDQEGGRGPATAQAQEPKANGEKTPPAPEPKDDGPKTLADRLQQRLDIEFIETPLKDVIDFLQDTTGIQFVLNQKRMEEAGVNIDTAITKNFQQVRLGTFLDLMLDELELVYVERDEELIIITTREDAAATMTVRVYDCRDLLELAIVGPAVPNAIRRGGAGGGGGGGFFGGLESSPGDEILAQVGGLGGAVDPAGAGATGGEPADGQAAGLVTEHDLRADRLIGVIVSAVDPESWVEAGGSGSISEYAGLIVISQSARTHNKVERVLTMLREAAGLETVNAKKVVR